MGQDVQGTAMPITFGRLEDLFRGCQSLSDKLDKIRKDKSAVAKREEVLMEITQRAAEVKKKANPEVVDAMTNIARLDIVAEIQMMLKAYNEGIFAAIILQMSVRQEIISEMCKSITAEYYLELWENIKNDVIKMLGEAEKHSEKDVRERYPYVFDYNPAMTKEQKTASIYYTQVPVTDGFEISLLFLSKNDVKEAYRAMQVYTGIGAYMKGIAEGLAYIADLLEWMIPEKERKSYTSENITASMHLHIRTSLVIQAFESLLEPWNEDQNYDDVLYATVISERNWYSWIGRFNEDTYRMLIQYDKYSMIAMDFHRENGTIPDNFYELPEELQAQFFYFSDERYPN